MAEAKALLQLQTTNLVSLRTWGKVLVSTPVGVMIVSTTHTVLMVHRVSALHGVCRLYQLAVFVLCGH